LRRLKTIDNLFFVNLGVKEKEKVLVLTDSREGEIGDCARSVAERGRELGFSVELFYYPPVSAHGEEPPNTVWDKVLLDTPDAIIAITQFSTSHTDFRRKLTKKGVRYASMPLFSLSMFSAMDVDYSEMRKRGERIRERLEGADWVEMRTPLGTSLRFSIKDRPVKIDTGILTKPGAFGNLPAGEVFVAPVEGTGEGRIVTETIPGKTLTEPLVIEIREGTVESISGPKDEVDRLSAIFAESGSAKSLAEFGIGINKKAKDSTNVLEAEKILGTVHIALGDNAGFGGKVSAPFHEDYVQFRPTVEIWKKERTKILEEGRLLL
jgi:leucyl aminopeptidase (aminopeptidase T)